jgi:hypothetical protein
MPGAFWARLRRAGRSVFDHADAQVVHAPTGDEIRVGSPTGIESHYDCRASNRYRIETSGIQLWNPAGKEREPARRARDQCRATTPTPRAMHARSDPLEAGDQSPRRAGWLLLPTAPADALRPRDPASRWDTSPRNSPWESRGRASRAGSGGAHMVEGVVARKEEAPEAVHCPAGCPRLATRGQIPGGTNHR